MAFGDKFRAEKRRKLFAKFRPGDNLIRQITSSGSSSGRGGGGRARREELARKAAEEAKRKAEIARKARVAAQRREAKRLSDLLQQKKLADQKKLIGAIRKREKLKNALKGNKSLQSRPDLLGKAQIAVKKKRAELLRTNTLTGQRLGVALGFSSSLLGGVRKVKIKTDVPKKPPKRVKFEDFSKSNQKRLQNIADGKKPLTQRVSEAEIKFIEKRITQPSIKALERKGIKVPEVLTKKRDTSNVFVDQLFLPGFTGSFARSGAAKIRKAGIKESIKNPNIRFKSVVQGKDTGTIAISEVLDRKILTFLKTRQIGSKSSIGKGISVFKVKGGFKFIKSNVGSASKQFKGKASRVKSIKVNEKVRKGKLGISVKGKFKLKQEIKDADLFTSINLKKELAKRKLLIKQRRLSVLKTGKLKLDRLKSRPKKTTKNNLLVSVQEIGDHLKISAGKGLVKKVKFGRLQKIKTNKIIESSRKGISIKELKKRTTKLFGKGKPKLDPKPTLKFTKPKGISIKELRKRTTKLFGKGKPKLDVKSDLSFTKPKGISIKELKLRVDRLFPKTRIAKKINVKSVKLEFIPSPAKKIIRIRRKLNKFNLSPKPTLKFTKPKGISIKELRKRTTKLFGKGKPKLDVKSDLIFTKPKGISIKELRKRTTKLFGKGKPKLDPKPTLQSKIKIIKLNVFKLKTKPTKLKFKPTIKGIVKILPSPQQKGIIIQSGNTFRRKQLIKLKQTFKQAGATIPQNLQQTVNKVTKKIFKKELTQLKQIAKKTNARIVSPSTTDQQPSNFVKSIPKTGIKTIPGIKNGVSFKTSTNVKSSSGKTSTGKGKFKLETISGKVKDKIKFTDILKRTDKIIKEKTKTKNVQKLKTKLKTPSKTKEIIKKPPKTRISTPEVPRIKRPNGVPPPIFLFLLKKKLIKKKKKGKRIGKGGFALVEGFTAKALNLKPIKIKAKDIRKFAKRFQTVGIRRRPVIIKSKRSKKKR